MGHVQGSIQKESSSQAMPKLKNLNKNQGNELTLQLKELDETKAKQSQDQQEKEITKIRKKLTT